MRRYEVRARFPDGSQLLVALEADDVLVEDHQVKLVKYDNSGNYTVVAMVAVGYFELARLMADGEPYPMFPEWGRYD